MRKNKSAKPKAANKPQPHSRGKASKDLPYPETDYSPTLQRTLNRKFEEAKARGEVESVDRDEFFRLLKRVSKPQGESSGEEQ